MQIIAELHSKEEYDLYFGLISLSPEQAKTILKIMDAVEKMKSDFPEIYRIELWDYSFSCHTSSEESESCQELNDQFNEMGWKLLENNVDFPEESAASIDCPRMLVQNDSIHWECYKRHCDVLISTSSVPKEVIEKIANRVDSSPEL